MVAPVRRAAWPPWAESRRAVLLAIAAAATLAAAALWARGGAGPDPAAPARAVGLLAWFALLMAAVRRPPRRRARRDGAVAVLRASALRRLSLPLLVGPALALVAWRTWRDSPGGAGAALAGLAALVVAGLVLAALRRGREIAFGPDGLVVRGRGGAPLRWERIREVRIETWRRHAGLVLLGEEGSPSLGVSAWVDGAPELAAELLARAPAAALAAPGVREALRALAGEPEGRPGGSPPAP